MKKKRFWFHYNKPMSQRSGRNVLTVHFGGVCHLVNGIVCEVPIYSKDNKRQPRCVMAGDCQQVNVLDGIAYIR